MPSCVFKHCKSCSQKQKKDDGVSFHRFPTDFDHRDEWIRIIRQSRQDRNWTPSKFCVVCSLHFDDDDMYFTAKGRRLTKKTAKPTRNLVGTTREDIAGANQDKAGTSMEISFGHVPNINREQCSPSNCVSSVKMEESGPSERIMTVKTEESSLSSNIHGIKQEQLDPLGGINVKVEPDSAPDIGHAEGTGTVELMSFESTNSIQIHEMAGSISENDDIRESDLDSMYDTAMENRLRKKLKKSENLCNSYRSKLRNAQRKIRRLEDRNFAMKKIITKKIQRDSSSENSIAAELFRRIYHKDTNRDIIYSEEFKNFCLTLYGHSPKAYEFVRETFNNCLLDPNRLTEKGPINSYSDVCAFYDYVDYVDG